jgi:thiamine-monophosphate kinase
VNEFDLIRRYFDVPTDDRDVVVGVGDDGAVIRPTPGKEQVQVIDTLVESVHFPGDGDPADIGYRAVAVNLSDIAAMGAHPRFMTLALSLPPKDEAWIAAFADGVMAAAAQHDVALIGGDMTSGAAVVATVHMTGEVNAGSAILRSGAQPGDTIYVTGTLGDAAGAFRLEGRGLRDDLLSQRFWRPEARVRTGLRLVGRATAAIDVSDGLLGDLNKLLQASGVGATVDIERVPLSSALQSHFDVVEQRQLALTGGDDYELCFTAEAAAVPGDLHCTAIGEITSTGELQCRLDGTVVEFDSRGYRHFQ